MRAKRTWGMKQGAWVAAALGLAVAGHAGAEPHRVLLVGDSIMQAVARATERELRRVDPAVRAESYTSLGSGLARLDLFDWHAQMSRLAEQVTPHTVVVMMGANDNQPMQTAAGVVEVGTEAWAAEYGRRVGEAMDRLLAHGARRLFWLELPDMREERLQRDIDVINAILRREADARDRVTFHPTRPVLSRTPGTFSPYILQANGMPLEVRARDGVHLNRQGADLLCRDLVPAMLGGRRERTR